MYVSPNIIHISCSDSPNNGIDTCSFCCDTGLSQGLYTTRTVHNKDGIQQGLYTTRMVHKHCKQHLFIRLQHIFLWSSSQTCFLGAGLYRHGILDRYRTILQNAFQLGFVCSLKIRFQGIILLRVLCECVVLSNLVAGSIRYLFVSSMGVFLTTRLGECCGLNMV